MHSSYEFCLKNGFPEHIENWSEQATELDNLIEECLYKTPSHFFVA
jgi:hypothetical protein